MRDDNKQTRRRFLKATGGVAAAAALAGCSGGNGNNNGSGGSNNSNDGSAETNGGGNTTTQGSENGSAETNGGGNTTTQGSENGSAGTNGGGNGATTGSTGDQSLKDVTLNFQGFGSHVPGWKSLATDFKKETGITVKVQGFQDDWKVLAKQRAGAKGLDIFQISMRAVPTGINQNLIYKLRIKNIPLADTIKSRYQPKNAPWEPDPNVWHAMPNHFGANSLAWNTDKWPYDKDPTSWKDLLQPKLKGEVGYSKRPNYAVCTIYLQFWPNEVMKFKANYDTRINKIWDSLKNDWKPQVGTWFAGGPDASQAFANQNVIAGQNFYVIIAQLQQQGIPIKGTIPKEGAYEYIDGLAIPAPVKDPKRKAAEEFINFSLKQAPRKQYLKKVPTGLTFPIAKKYQSDVYKKNINVKYEDRLAIFDPVFVGNHTDQWTTKIQEIIRS